MTSMTPGSRRTILLVLAAVMLLVGGVAWISLAAIRAARQEAAARERAAIEEAVRLALWRIDSFVGPILSRAQLVAMGHTVELGSFVSRAPLQDTAARKDAINETIGDIGKKKPPPPMKPQPKIDFEGEPYQRVRSRKELAVRAKNVEKQMLSSLGLPEDAPVELLRPVWIGEELMLVQVGSNFRARINWPALERRLRSEISDLLPAAELTAAKDNDDRRLASLPVRLEPGPLATPASDIVSSLWVGLGVAWGSVVLAVLAVGALLVGAVTLSERRAVFVSAVTHELRTPLTTFRTYTEMLVREMVPEAARREYLETLRVEADRLAHLTENVLLYARLERGRGGERVEDVALRSLFERLRPRLEARAAQAGMMVQWPDDDLCIKGDATAVEQILFNLVDNACKYAQTAEDRRIIVEARLAGDDVCIDVQDRGPGIALADRRRLFQPFSRSAREAAGRAPGVGLGLALSRRLARAMGGELWLTEAQSGACFRLRLTACDARSNR